jgi:hypothetical protein
MRKEHQRVLPLRLSVLAAATVVPAPAAPAAADAPKFTWASSSVNTANARVVNLDERGLGETNIDHALSADATALCACVNAEVGRTVTG